MIYIFRTKNSTNKFVDAFAQNSGKTCQNFDAKQGNTTSGDEALFQYNWPNFSNSIPEGAEFCFQGLIRGTHKLKPFFETNRWYYFDQPYFYYTHYQNHKDFNDQWYRINVNDVQTTKIDDNPKHMERYNKLLETSPEEIELQNWRTSGSHILVIPPSFHTARWFGINENKWVHDTVNKIKQHTDRPIKIRYKYKDGLKFGGPKERVDSDKPLSEDLVDCWAMVSFHSMCASHAVRRGIPSFASEHSPAAPVSYSLSKLDRIENPLMNEREKWMATLLGSQFKLEEMKSGMAYRYLNEF